MNIKATYYGIGGVILGALIVWLGMNRINGMMNQYPMENSIQIDAYFIEQMIPHHEDAIIMAELALTKAEHDEIKQLAQSITNSQSREIDQMKTWYSGWFGRKLSSSSSVGMHHGMGGHMGMTQIEMTRLEQADNFDKAFIESMIPHHQMAVMMASMLKSGTNRSEMKQLADDIIAAQSNEIDQMQEWYNAWF